MQGCCVVVRWLLGLHSPGGRFAGWCLVVVLVDTVWVGMGGRSVVMGLLGHVAVVAAALVRGMVGVWLGLWSSGLVVWLGGWVRLLVGTLGLVGCRWGKKVEACARVGMWLVGWVGRVVLYRLVW